MCTCLLNTTVVRLYYCIHVHVCIYYTDVRSKVITVTSLLNTTVVRLYYCIHACIYYTDIRSKVITVTVYLSVIGLQVLEVDIFEVEEKINYGFTELAVKLSEISFRPIFLKVGY